MLKTRNNRFRRGISIALAIALVLTTSLLPDRGYVYGAWVDTDDDRFDIHTNIFEIQFTLEYTQYLDLAVYAGDGVTNWDGTMDPVGYIFKMKEVRGNKDYEPQPYRKCPAGGSGGAHDYASTDMEYRDGSHLKPALAPLPIWPFAGEGASGTGDEQAAGESSVGEAADDSGSEFPGQEGSEAPEMNDQGSDGQGAPTDTKADLPETGGEESPTAMDGADSATEEPASEAPEPVSGTQIGESGYGLRTGSPAGESTGDASPVGEGSAVSSDGGQGGEGRTASSDGGQGYGEADNDGAPNKETTGPKTDESGGAFSAGTDGDEGGQPGDAERESGNTEEAKPDERSADEGGEAVDSVDVEALLDLPPQATVLSVRQLTKEEWLQERVQAQELSLIQAVWDLLNFKSYIEFEEYDAPDGDGNIGHNTLYWDGRYDHNAGTGLDPDYYPAVGPEMDQDRHAVMLEFQFVGYPWENIAPTCYDAGGGNIVHQPGENWEWTSHESFRIRSNAYVIDYRLGEYLKIAQDELSGCVLAFLEQYLNGYIDFEDLVYLVDEGDPVNMVSGGYHFQYTDLETYGQWPLQWIRIYNSLDENDSGLGKGFSHIYDYTLIDDKGIIRIEGPYGQKILFLREPNGSGGDSYRPLQDTDFTLESGDRDVYRMTHDSTGSVFTIADGKLTQIVNPGGYVIARLTYDASGRLFRMENDWNAAFVFTWEDGHITSVRDHTGRAITYAYTDDGEHDLLSSFTNPDGDSLRYTYEGGYLASQTDYRGNVYLENSYDEQGRVVKQTIITEGGTSAMTVSYDEENLVNTVKTFDGETKHYHYDEYGMLLGIEEEDGGLYENTWTEQYKADGKSSKGKLGTEYTFDSDGNVIEAVYQDGNTITAEYDSSGRIVKKTYRRGGSETYRYDSRGNLIAFTDREGNTTSYVYQDGLLVKVTDPEGYATSYGYNGLGQQITVTDPLGHVTRYAYDGLGRLAQVTDPLGAETTYTYTEAGKLLSITNAHGDSMTYEYDADGNVLLEMDFNGNITRHGYGMLSLISNTIDAEGNQTLYFYNLQGHLEKYVDAAGNETTFSYDQKGRLKSVSDANEEMTTYAYNELGWIIELTDEEGHSQVYEYDVMGRQSAMINKNGYRTTYEYDYDGNQIRSVQEGTNGDAVTEHTYDYVGRRTKTVDAEGHVWTYTYDRRGLMTGETDPEGRTTTYVYDGAGRQTALIDGEGNRTAYAYDAGGNVIQMTNPRGYATAYTYDLLGRLVTQTSPGGGVTSYTYDPNGNVLTMTDAAGAVTRYTYDKLNRTSTMTSVLAADGGGRWSIRRLTPTLPPTASTPSPTRTDSRKPIPTIPWALRKATPTGRAM